MSIEINESDFYEEEFDNSHRRVSRGAMLKLIREKKGLSSTEMARFLKVNRTHYSQIENGKKDVNMCKLDEWLCKLGMGQLSIVL